MVGRAPLDAERRQWLRDATGGNPWTLERPTEPVAIAMLASPLRLDILVRASYFDFYAEHRGLYRSDFDAYADLAREHDYFTWFTRIMCVAWQPHVLSDPAAMAAAWADRIRRAAALYDSFERQGFDERFPVTLYAARRVLATDTGKYVTRDLFAGDGNHRLALLLNQGHTEIRPGQYRIKRFLRLEPPDTTEPLLRALRMDPERYLAFLRAGYPTVRVERRGGALTVTSQNHDGLAEEVRRLADIDARQLPLGDAPNLSTPTASRDEVQEFLDSTEFTGYQAVPLPHGMSLPGLDRRDRIEQALRIPLKGKSYLDVGTYYGIFPYEALQRGAARAVGLEPAAERYAVANRIAELHGNAYEIRQGRVEDLPPGEKFDVVTFTNVLHHVEDPIAAVKRLVDACNETLVIEFCLPDDPEMLVQLYDRREAPRRWSWWIAKARSLTLRAVAGRLPLMAVGNYPIHRTFYFTPTAFENLFRVHLGWFESIEFEPAATGQRRVMAYCRIA